MKFSVFTLIILLTPFTFAKNLSSRAPEALTDGSGGASQLYLGVIPYAKGAGFSLGYEKDMGENVGFGGQLTVLPEEETGTNQAAGMVSLGAQVRFHFVVKMFDMYLAPGLNFMKMKFRQLDDTTLGASLTVGSLVQISKHFAVGVEFSTFQPWFKEDFYVHARSYYFTSSLTGRVTF